MSPDLGVLPSSSLLPSTNTSLITVLAAYESRMPSGVLLSPVRAIMMNTPCSRSTVTNFLVTRPVLHRFIIPRCHHVEAVLPPIFSTRPLMEWNANTEIRNIIVKLVTSQAQNIASIECMAAM